jgi:hypothetical protein
VAALRRRGRLATRTTVRPHGHPYDRIVSFDEAQLAWLARERAAGATAVIVDEGPGMSGSSFLSVADALVGAGFPLDRIDLFCSRRPDPNRLVARDAARRWSALRVHAPRSEPRLPAGAAQWIGGGRWRARAFVDEAEWPASWPMMERAKFLSEDQRTILKFEGLGPYGAEVLARAEALADAGFGAPVEDAGRGYLAYRHFIGPPMKASQADTAVLARLACYSAARAQLAPAGATTDLEPMLRQNMKAALHAETAMPALEVVRPVIADSRMMPHEWIATEQGYFKSDGTSHGDDHFFPGPVDIAWDLAGVIVEWQLSRESSDFFLEAYQRASGDRPRSRLLPYVFAYALFRLSYAKMVACNVDDDAERKRALESGIHYHALLTAMASRADTKAFGSRTRAGLP